MSQKISEHHFNVEDAKKYGVKKAILLYNLKYWLDKNKANNTNKYKHSNGKKYYWTYNSSEAFEELFPYFSARSIRRWLKEMEEEEIIISNTFNQTPYDHTKWYTTPSFMIKEQDDRKDTSIGQNDQSNGKDNQSSYTDNKPNNKQKGSDDQTSSPKRKDVKFPKEDYNKVTEAYKRIKGVEPQGREWKPIEQTIKTMFMSDRQPEEIISLMEWLEESNEDWTSNWTIRTVKMKMPEFVANKLKGRKPKTYEY